MGDLSDLATEYRTDKGPEGHNYTPHYEHHFAPLRREPLTLLEIGVAAGASLRMWEGYFPFASIVGVDIRPEVEVNTGRVRTLVTDIKQYAPDRVYDIVVDDGSHDADDIVEAFALLWHHVTPGGWYVIEDLDTQLPDSPALALIAGLLSELYHERGEVSEVHIYNQIAFLRRRGGEA